MAGETKGNKDGGGVLDDASKKPKKSRSKSQQKSVSKTDSNFVLNFDIPGDSNVEDEAWKCIECNVVFAGDNDKVLECERCQSQHCIKCLGKSDKEYKWLQESDSMWFCSNCRLIVKKHIVTDLKIEEKCRAIMEKCEQRLKDLEDTMKTKCDENMVRRIIEEERNQTLGATVTAGDSGEEAKQTKAPPCVTANIMSEINDRKARECNIVIYGIGESNSEIKDDRIAHDCSKVSELLLLCKAISEADQGFTKPIRLGKFQKDLPEEERKNRPLLVPLTDLDVKKALFRNIKNMGQSEDYQKISICNDLTKAERNQEKLLRKEAAKKKQENSSGEYTYKVRGPPWARKVMKVRTTKAGN